MIRAGMSRPRGRQKKNMCHRHSSSNLRSSNFRAERFSLSTPKPDLKKNRGEFGDYRCAAGPGLTERLERLQNIIPGVKAGRRGALNDMNTWDTTKYA